MGEHGVAVAFLHLFRKGVAKLRRQRRILGDLAGFERRLQRHFRRRQKDRQLGAGEAAIFLGAAHQLLIALQPLDGAVEPAIFLKDLDRAHQGRQSRRATALGDRQSEGLQPVVLEHDLGDLFGHLDQQGVAVRFGQPSFDHLAVQRDLDVDLIVRAVDAGRIVDEIGVDPAADARIFDPPRLSDGEVRAFADRLGAKLGAVHPDRIVGRVADLRTAL